MKIVSPLLIFCDFPTKKYEWIRGDVDVQLFEGTHACNLYHITSHPFVSVDNVEHVFFADVKLHFNWKYVHQSHARKYMIFDNMDAPILDDEGHVTGLLDDGNAPEESVVEEDIKEDNDDAQDTSESSDGEADYANTTYIGTSNIELEFKYDSAYNIIACEYAYQSF